jgi:hypothetical protein
MTHIRRGALLAALGALALASPGPSEAEESQFGYVYTTDLLPKGAKELEQWATWRHQKIGGYFDQIDARTEFEYGLTDSLQTAIYANYAWSRAYHNGPFGATTPPEPFSYDIPGPDEHYRATRFVGVSGEIIYRALSPYTDALGVAFYEEPTVGPGFYELETKLILQKNFLDDRLIFAFNYTYAPELRYLSDTAGGPKKWQEETDTNAYFAGSFRFRANWSAGFEFLNEREYNSYNFSHATNSGFFLGPSFHYGGRKFFVTATFLEQLPWAGTHADTVPGAISGGRDFDNDFEKYRLRIKLGIYL